MSEFNLEIRKKQLQSLKQYIKSSEDNLNSVFHTLGWNMTKTIEDVDPKVTCPLNKRHLISQKTCKEHLEKCTLKSEGYKINGVFLSEPPENEEFSIKLNNSKKIEICNAARTNKSDFKHAWNGRDSDPLTSDRYSSTFSVDERLAIYDYSVKHTKSPPKPDEFTLDFYDPNDKKELTEKERLLLERDAKRRRTKYKSVHTSKKNYTEIARELIDNQMGLYVDWIKEKKEKQKREKEKLKKRSTQQLNANCDSQHSYSDYNNTQIYQAQSVGYNNQNVSQDGVIRDWSHLYQGGMDIYTSQDQYQSETQNDSTYSSNKEAQNSFSSYGNYEEPTNSRSFTQIKDSSSSSVHNEKSKREKSRFKEGKLYNEYYETREKRK